VAEGGRGQREVDVEPVGHKALEGEATRQGVEGEQGGQAPNQRSGARAGIAANAIGRSF
jgi:hypothetical protein